MLKPYDLCLMQMRNVLDLIRRREGMRFEDFMILDPSVFYGMADMHDRHRDMRLDIDNMSYEVSEKKYFLPSIKLGKMGRMDWVKGRVILGSCQNLMFFEE